MIKDPDQYIRMFFASSRHFAARVMASLHVLADAEHVTLTETPGSVTAPSIETVQVGLFTSSFFHPGIEI